MTLQLITAHFNSRYSSFTFEGGGLMQRNSRNLTLPPQKKIFHTKPLFQTILMIHQSGYQILLCSSGLLMKPKAFSSFRNSISRDSFPKNNNLLLLAGHMHLCALMASSDLYHQLLTNASFFFFSCQDSTT